MISPKKICQVCGKGYRKAVQRSHSMRSTIKKLQPNLQWLKLPSNKRIKACTRCIKSISRNKITVPKPSAK